MSVTGRPAKKHIRSRLRARRSLLIETLEPRHLLAGLAMSDEEQLVIELINRARQSPAVEAARLGIDLNQGLPAGTISSAPKQPLAPNQLLIDVASAHSQDMIDRSFFDHVNPDGKEPGDRLTEAGYPWIAWGENIAWGTHLDGEGFHELLFLSSGHRKNILSEIFREIGVGIRRGSVLKGTEIFGDRSGHAFVTGVAFTDDLLEDNFFSLGEGAENVTITARPVGGGAAHTTTTGPTGGYSLRVPPATYTVTADRADLPRPIVVTDVVIAAENAKVDFIVDTSSGSGSPPVAERDRNMTERGQAVTVDVLANDSDDIGLNQSTVTVVAAPKHGQFTIHATTGAITYRPDTNFVGLDKLTYTVRDDEGLESNEAQVAISVIDLQNAPWRNPQNSLDVNCDGSVTAEDALDMISDINANQARALPVPSPQAGFPPLYLDVTGEGDVSARDLLRIINFINANASNAGEGEPDSDDLVATLSTHSLQRGQNQQRGHEARVTTPFWIDTGLSRSEQVAVEVSSGVDPQLFLAPPPQSSANERSESWAPDRVASCLARCGYGIHQKRDAVSRSPTLFPPEGLDNTLALFAADLASR